MAALTLELIDLRPGPLDDRSWMPPFDEAVNYANPHWWNPLLYDTEHPWYVQVLEAGAEVARVELKEDVDIEHYANVPTGVRVARWLGWDWESHVPLLERVTAPAYDPFACFAGTHQRRLRHT